MNARTKIVLLGLLTVLAVGTVIFAAYTSVQAFQNVQQQHRHAQEGDVRAIRPWMTIHYISRIYHVPENYLYQSLGINDPLSFRHDNLTEIADREHRPVDEIIHTLQGSILTYRKDHPPPHASLAPSLSMQLIKEGATA